MMAAGSSAPLACSWTDDGGSLADCTVHLCFEEEGMAQAEHLVQEALCTAPVPSTRVTLTNPTVAPWLELTVGDFGIVALCVVANARVLEIHEVTGRGEGDDKAVTTTPLLTQEAQLADASTGLHAHFLCHGGSGALFPPMHVYRLKLFGRTPRSEVCVAKVCLVLLRAAVPTLGQCLSASPESPAAEGDTQGDTAVPSAANTLEILLRLQRQFFVMEQRVDAAFECVAQRLARLESRVCCLEAPRAVATTAHDAAPTQAQGNLPVLRGVEEEEGRQA
ncbi:hypothetical protein ABL78_7424 [Leptomonas seymouri]|uniref:Uncharacterized protein n=1 Tax=Leptomonas seymouri TaxID=5684 RepID=A0A0N0P2Z5_LEPSE|nr:hypothetical protein ABL78_7424 [Leptomonas seymouri]|eukprot:KPI83539.1 hypothetical protein ABL78_7424 [Leptomonas seymouri]